MDIEHAESDEDLRRCFLIMQALRTHLDDVGVFVGQVRRQMASSGYAMLFVEAEGEVVAVAGYRISECLAWGKYLYVDDLVTDPRRRSAGYGAALIERLYQIAYREGCAQFHLDSGVQRFRAHRFYFEHGLHISSYHFSKEL